MSKRDLKKYLAAMPKEELQEQMLALYEKFPDVKAYYNFIFNPKEDKLEQEAKAKINNEYFPLRGKRARLRRSVAQKYIKHFITIGVDPNIVADVMLYNIETAQKYSAKREMRYGSFYKSMLNSFRQVIEYTKTQRIAADFKVRFDAIANEAARQKWENREEFDYLLDHLDD